MRPIPFFIAFLLAYSQPLFAQDNASDVPKQEFTTNRFVPAVGADNYMMVEGASFAGRMTPSAGIMLDYAHRPFVIFDADCKNNDPDKCEMGDAEKAIVQYQFDTNLYGALAFLNRFQVGLLLPLTLTSGDRFEALVGADNGSKKHYFVPGGSAFGIGDIRLSGKARIVGQGSQRFFLAAVAYLTAPTGRATASGRFVGNEGLTGGLGLAAEFRQPMFRVAANLGGAFRANRELLSTSQGSEFTYGLAGSVTATPLLSVLAELVGSTSFTSAVDENPLEARLAGQLRQGDFFFTVGGGVGLISGVGVPVFRALAGAAWQPQGLDADNDGIADEKDQCPAEPEDRDGYMDEDGCPDDDNDGDGLPDKADKCSDQPEDFDKFKDEDGCPDTDNDGDGIPDGYDSCPNDPEDKNGYQDDDGCPEHDKDHDGISDDKDKCPDQAEDFDGVCDADGCPDTDCDNDGLLDDQDECPEQAGTKESNGCPDTGGVQKDLSKGQSKAGAKAKPKAKAPAKPKEKAPQPTETPDFDFRQ
jgi:OOP family OmpA-OmpF porin